MPARRRLLPLSAVLAALVLGPIPAAAQGEAYDFGCPPGHALVGLTGWQDWWMDGVRGVRQIDLGAGRVTTTRRNTPVAGSVKGTARTHLCPSGTVMTGFTGSRAAYVLTVHSLRCTPLQPGGAAESGGSFVNAFPKKSAPPGQNGYFLANDCSGGQVALRIRGREGLYVDYFNITCGYLPGAQPTATASTTPTGTVTAPISRTTVTTVTRPVAPAAPSLVSPANGHQVVGRPPEPGCYDGVQGFPEFRWNAVEHGARYVVEIENVTQNRRTRRASTTTRASMNIGTARYIPAAGSSYRWRVRAVNAIGMEGPWSGYRSFSASTAQRTSGTCTVAAPLPVIW